MKNCRAKLNHLSEHSRVLYFLWLSSEHKLALGSCFWHLAELSLPYNPLQPKFVVGWKGKTISLVRVTDLLLNTILDASFVYQALPRSPVLFFSAILSEVSSCCPGSRLCRPRVVKVSTTPHPPSAEPLQRKYPAQCTWRSVHPFLLLQEFKSGLREIIN